MSGFMEQFSQHAEELPQQETRRAENWQANREDNTKPYVNNNPNARNAAKETQKDLSYYAWNRLYRFAPVPNEFEQSVNIAFKADNGEINGKNFDEKRSKYIALYKRMLADL